MLQHEEEAEVDVRKEDQMRINQFGQNNARIGDIQTQLNEMRQKMETLDDAMADVMMGEGDNLQVLISETFVECSEDSATEYLEKLSQKLSTQVDTLTSEMEELTKKQAGLKKSLYGRFGSSINLEV